MQSILLGLIAIQSRMLTDLYFCARQLALRVSIPRQSRGLRMRLFRLQILDGLGKTALGAGGGVGVQHVLGCGLVDLLGGSLKCGSAGLDVTRLDRGADLANRRADRRTNRTVVQTAILALAEAFFGTGGIRHFGRCSGLRVESWSHCPGQRSLANHPLSRNWATLSSRSETSL